MIIVEFAEKTISAQCSGLILKKVGRAVVTSRQEIGHEPDWELFTHEGKAYVHRLLDPKGVGSVYKIAVQQVDMTNDDPGDPCATLEIVYSNSRHAGLIYDALAPGNHNIPRRPL